MAECLQYEGLTEKVPDVVFVRPRQARLLQGGPAKIVLIALREIDKIVMQLIHCTSKEQFVDLRQKVFSDYANLSYILAKTFSISNDRAIRQAVIRQAFQGVERLFETKGVPRLGTDVIRESIFCIETLRRAYKLVDVLYSRGSVAEAVREADHKLAHKFNTSTLWAQINLDCLRLIITEEAGIDAEILQEILQGSRFSVMAYAYVREGIELRTKREPFLADATLDDEDRELLQESFLDYESSLDAEP